MTTEQLYALLGKITRGIPLTEDEETLRKQYQQIPEEKLAALLSEPDWMELQNATPNSTELLASQQAEIAVLARTGQAPSVVVNARPWWRKSALQAACAAGIIMLAIFFFKKENYPAVLPIAWNEIHTNAGERKLVKLSDGTILHINGKSNIKYPVSWSDTSREIELVSGEIYLEVAENATKPFLLKTNELLVKVLGTSFAVRSKAAGNQVSVSVSSGRVMFGMQNNPALPTLVLSAGQKGVYSRSGQSLQQASISADMVGAWTKGIQYFDEVSLDEILSTLEDQYGYRYHIGTKQLADRHFKATFKGKSPEEMIRVLAKMGDFNYSIKDSIIIIQ